MPADNDNREPLPTPVAFSHLLTEMAEAYGQMTVASSTGDKDGAEAFAAVYQERRVRLCEAYERALANAAEAT